MTTATARVHPVLSSAAVLAWLLAVIPLHAATPREEVLRVVPEDAGFCFLVQHLRERRPCLIDAYA